MPRNIFLWSFFISLAFLGMALCSGYWWYLIRKALPTSNRKLVCYICGYTIKKGERYTSKTHYQRDDEYGEHEYQVYFCYKCNETREAKVAVLIMAGAGAIGGLGLLVATLSGLGWAFGRADDGKAEPEKPELVPQPAPQVQELGPLQGRTLGKWVVDGKVPNLWRIENDELICSGRAGPGNGALLTPDDYTDYRFRCQFQLSAEGHAGIGHRYGAGQVGWWVRLWDEARIGPGTGGLWFALRPEQVPYGEGIAFELAKHVPTVAGKWHQAEITITGSKVVVQIDGNVVVATDLREEVKTHENQPELLRDRGRIALVNFTTEPVRFRNIELVGQPKKP